MKTCRGGYLSSILGQAELYIQRSRIHEPPEYTQFHHGIEPIMSVNIFIPESANQGNAPSVGSARLQRS